MRLARTWASWVAVGVEHGKGAAVHDGARFVDPAVQVGQHRLEHLLRVDGGERLGQGVDPAVGEHVGDEPLHAGGTGGDELDEIVGVGVEPASVALLAAGQRTR